MQDEMIPLSANIFHAKGDKHGRAMAALDIVIACLPDLFSDVNDRDNAIEWAQMLHTILSPAGYDVRGELGAALRGDDTAAPKEAEDGKGPLYVATFDGFDVGVFSTREAAMLAGAVTVVERELDKKSC